MPGRVTRPAILPPTPPTPPVVSAATVREAEKLLRLAGFNPGTVDGRVSPAFTSAVREFQGAWGLAVTGQVDSATLAKMRTTGKRIRARHDDLFVSIGQRSSSIKTVESRLKKLGYDPGKVDGIYSRETAEAVKQFKADQADIENDAGSIGRHGRAVLAREVEALAHAPERRRLAPTASQRHLDAKTAHAVASGLGEGAHGSAVKNVQKHLRAAGFDPHRADGVFDERTAGALKAFQQRAGLAPSGVVDSRTWKELKKSFILSKKPASPAQSLGERSSAVKASEKLLKKLGFNPGKVDGLFDRRTHAAVKAFEKKHHLERDGKIGAHELEQLKKLAASAGGIQVTPAMRRLASAGRSVALSMGGYRGLGLCATGVSRAIRGALGIGVWGNGNQIDNNLPRSKFRQVHLSLAEALKIPGLILTWERTSSALGSRYGHTAITTGNGYSSTSDFIERNTLAAGGRTGLKIFVPIV